MGLRKRSCESDSLLFFLALNCFLALPLVIHRKPQPLVSVLHQARFTNRHLYRFSYNHGLKGSCKNVQTGRHYCVKLTEDGLRHMEEKNAAEELDKAKAEEDRKKLEPLWAKHGAERERLAKERAGKDKLEEGKGNQNDEL